MRRMVANMVAVVRAPASLAVTAMIASAQRYMLPLPDEAAVRSRQGTRGRPPSGHLIRRLPRRERSNSQSEARGDENINCPGRSSSLPGITPSTGLCRRAGHQTFQPHITRQDVLCAIYDGAGHQTSRLPNQTSQEVL